MKFYEKQEAIETLEAILVQYDKRALSESLSVLAAQYLKDNGSVSFKAIEDLILVKQNGKYAIKIGNEE